MIGSGDIAEIVKDLENGMVGGIEMREEVQTEGDTVIIVMGGMEEGVGTMTVIHAMNVIGADHDPLLGVGIGGDLKSQVSWN